MIDWYTQFCIIPNIWKHTCCKTELNAQNYKVFQQIFALNMLYYIIFFNIFLQIKKNSYLYYRIINMKMWFIWYFLMNSFNFKLSTSSMSFKRFTPFCCFSFFMLSMFRTITITIILYIYFHGFLFITDIIIKQFIFK